MGSTDWNLLPLGSVIDQVNMSGSRAPAGSVAAAQGHGATLGVGTWDVELGDQGRREVDRHGEGGRGLLAEIVGGGDRDRRRASGANRRRVAPDPLVIELPHFAQRRRERDGVEALGVVEEPGIRDKAAFVGRDGRHRTGDRRRVVLDLIGADVHGPASDAQQSHCPRWSFTSGGVKAFASNAGSPALIAGLLGGIASVCVRSPLLASVVLTMLLRAKLPASFVPTMSVPPGVKLSKACADVPCRSRAGCNFR